MEIERKWLLKKLPQQEPDEKYWVEQFYLSLEPEVRLRRCSPNGDYENKVPYRITVKGNGTLSRQELESAIDEEFYEQALDFVNLEPIQKHYLVYHESGYEISVAVILNVETFVYAEVEFTSEEEANSYEFPWLDLVEKEVTDDQNFKMKNYWKRTRL